MQIIQKFMAVQTKINNANYPKIYGCPNKNHPNKNQSKQKPNKKSQRNAGIFLNQKVMSDLEVVA